jgi:calcineurin-like phosphoesterase family protein
MSNTWFTSDLHIGHRLVAGHRGFELEHPQAGELGLRVMVPYPEAHDAALADNWDAVVSPQDRVFVLGDVSMNFKPEVADWIRARPGIKHLVAGNHDQAHPMHTRYLKELPKFLEVFETVQPFLRLKMLGETVLLSHFPYEGEGDRPGPDRHTQYRLRDEGAFLLHGHTHGQERGHGYQFHVGLDAWDLKLVPHQTILDWIQEHKDAKENAVKQAYEYADRLDRGN